ncbi:maleylpyruvate isomerase N-terminal domain-containing protein [Streptomyces fuscigenes]|uniref:maleylpyruvate isomerase N-terminal domain-containing protein n=1 Tax=Streptomyces fuscigenes TaxID=1528880 RepID=UPI001F468DE6|nr:maleylpyruvate isomerase N-terminal domain-containing protein [Streptomyces fuscigenes]MCF3963811.1 maleylpyruvate isomerase N-terminal domain-containing protein [Streptomyces fuscigenes]
MTALAHARYCDEIVGQADALCALLDAAGPDALARPVPTCPEWDAAQLVRHVGESLRWIWHVVHTRAQRDVSRADVPYVDGPDDARELTAWLAGSARLVAGALRDAGPGVPVWSWAWESSTGFWARRMCHEVAVHRADAVFACHGADAPLDAYRLEPAVAADAIDEWLRIVEFAAAAEGAPRTPPGVGGTLLLHAADAPGARWLVEIGGPRFRWRRGDETGEGGDERENDGKVESDGRAGKADTAVGAPLTALLLAAVRRLPVRGPAFDVTGDRALLDFFLETARFG